MDDFVDGPVDGADGFVDGPVDEPAEGSDALVELVDGMDGSVDGMDGSVDGMDTSSIRPLDEEGLVAIGGGGGGGGERAGAEGCSANFTP